MRLVHLADLHLGYRQYQRLTPSGINQREADVARAFRRAIDATIALKPDLILIAGDVFHQVRPTNPAILYAFTEFARLTRELPQAKVVMIAGNHDTPRVAETGCILRLFAPLGIHVVDQTSQRFAFPDLDLSVLAVPHSDDPKLVPDPEARYNVLLLHREVPGVIPSPLSAEDRGVLDVSVDDLGPDRWSYVALGHYHVYHQVRETAYYSGSLDYTSLDIWGERAEEQAHRIPGKGFIEHDLATGTHRFHSIELPRELIDLPTISGRGLTSADLDERIRAAVDSCKSRGGIDDKIVRLLVREVPRHISRELDHRALREYKRRALHFHLDVRRPDPIRLHAHGAPGRRPSLADIVREKLQNRLLEGDINREDLVTLGLKYLNDADMVPVAATALSEEREA